MAMSDTDRLEMLVSELRNLPADDRYGRLEKMAEILVTLDEIAEAYGFGSGAIAAYAAVIRRTGSNAP